MRFALVWISATITTVTAIIAAEHAQSNADRRVASFNFICAEQGEKHPGGEKLHPQSQTLRMLLPKGRENTSTWSSRSGFSRLHKNAFQGQVSTEGAETWRASPAASERQWQLQRNIPHQISRAERDGLREQHDRMQLTYDSPSVKHMSFPKDSLRNVDADSVLYTPKIKDFDTIDAPYWLEKPASLSGRHRSPGERLDYSSTRMQPKHPAVHPPQRLPEEPHTLGEVDLEDMYGPGSLQHQKRKAYPNGIEVLVSGSEAFPSQGHYPRGSEDTSRQKPAVIRTNYSAQPDALTRPRATPETHSLLTRRSEKRSYPQQQQREARPQSRDMLNIVQGGKHSVINQRQPTEEGRLPPLRHFNPSSEESNRNYGSSASGASSKKQSLLGGRQKVATAKDSLFGKTDISMKRRKERRSYRKGDTVNAMDIDVAASSRAGSAPLHRKNDKIPQHEIHANALSTEEYLVDTAEELPRMSKSVLDLGVDDLQMLADILYDLKAAHYAERLEEGSKRREAQEGMFFSRLNRSQERQKLLRRENELKDEKKLKSLEESLRFTKPLSAYHDLFLGGGAHKGERNSGTGIRSHKDSDYKKRIRMADETGHERGGTTVRRSPKKKGNWREKRQKQMIALDLIEREDQAEEGSGRTSRPRRRSARGAEEQENGEGTYSGAEGENLNRRVGSMFPARKSVPTTPDKRDDPPSVVDSEDLRGPSQTKEKREAGRVHTENEGRKNLVDNQGEVVNPTSPGRNAEFSEQQEASAAQIKWAGKNAHARPPGVATTGLHKTDTVQRDTIEDEQHENIAEKGQDGGTELDTFDLLSTGGTNTATGLLPAKAFSSADAEAVMVDEKSGEVLSAVIDDDGAEKVLAEKIYEDSLHQRGSEQTDGASKGLQNIITAPLPGQHVVPEKGTEKVHQGETTHVQADLNGVQEYDSPHLLPSDSKSQRLGQPPVDEQYTREHDDGMEKVEDIDILTKNRAPIFDVSNPSKEFISSNLSSADASETLVKPQLTAGMQDKDRATSGGSPEEDEGVEGSEDDEGESEGESVEGEPESEVPSGTLTLADDVPVTAEEYTFSEESGPEPFTLEALLTNIVTSRAAQSPLRQPNGGSSHRLEEDSPILETAPNITEGETSSEGRLSERKFRKEATRLIDTYASRGNAGLSAEVTKNPGRPMTFKRVFEHTVDAPSSSSTESLPLSPSRLARFRARHFRSDTTDKPESVGKQADRFFDRSAQNRHGDQASLSLPTGREDIYFSPYRRLQFTSKKKSVLDRNTSARLEFVDNDHGSQFVNWRSIDGERMIEKLWVSSMEEADRHQRKQVRREIESAFANEFDAVRTKKQLLQALGVSGPDEGENEQQLAQRYYSAMQEVLHGSEEEVLTGQAFGRYIPSINQSFITDLRNRIIYGPWSVNWNRAITSRTQRVSVGSRRGAVSVGSSASSYVTTVNVNWGRVAVTFAARPNDQAVKVGVLRGRYGVDIARSNRLRTSAVETVMRYVESATVVDQINRTYGQRIRVRRFSFNYTRDFTLPAFDSPGRTPGLRQELGVNWGTVGISVGTDVPDSEYAVSVGLRGYQFSVLRDFFQRLIQAQGNWGRGWQFELAAKIEDPISPLIYYQFGFGRLGRLYSTAGAGVGGDNTPMALFQIQGDRSSVAIKALEQAGVRIFNIGFTVGRFTYSWDSVVNYDQITLPLSHISPILKALLHVTP